MYKVAPLFKLDLKVYKLSILVMSDGNCCQYFLHLFGKLPSPTGTGVGDRTGMGDRGSQHGQRWVGVRGRGSDQGSG